MAQNYLRVKSGEFRVEIWCVRRADTFLLYCDSPFGCRGEHCSPAAFTRCIANAGTAARAVNDRPYGVVIFYCPVGRGVWRLPQNCTERSRPFPTNNRKARYHRENADFRQVCRGRIYASRGVYPLYRITGAAATGGIYAAPTKQPVKLSSPQNRGRGLPRPYRAFFLNVPAPRALLIYYLLSLIFYLLKTNRAPADSGGGAMYLTAPWTKMPSGARFRGLQKIPAGACPP